MSAEAIDAKNDVQAAPAENPDEEALKALREEIRSLLGQRRGHRSRLLRFQRQSKYFAKHLPENVKEDSEEKKKLTVKNAYQLLRSFCFSYNFITIADKEAEKFCIPADFEAELKEVLTEEFFGKFSTAIKSSKDDFEKELPEFVSEQVIEKLLKFVSVKQTTQIHDKYEDHLKTLTEQIEAKTKDRDAIQPPRAPRERKESQKKQKRQRRNSQDSESSNLEDRLQDILKEVSRRSDSVRFSKDDFESFSEAQT